MALRASLPDAPLVHNPLHVTTDGDVRQAATWLADEKFHRFREFKVGARVMLTSNLSVEKGLINGTVGTIHHYELHPAPTVGVDPAPPRTIKYIYLTVPGHARPVRLSRTVQASITVQGVRFRKTTFPLTLAYSITGHKAQGSTMRGLTIVHMREAFTHGLAYVMLSRVTTRDNLRIVGGLTPEQCLPMPEIEIPPLQLIRPRAPP
jgi:ATP-dependent DNA helicase PIF1